MPDPKLVSQGRRSASRIVPTAASDNTRVSPRQAERLPQTIGPAPSRAASALNTARNISGTVDALASAAEAGISARRGEIAGALGAAAMAAAAIMTGPAKGTSALRRRGLGAARITPQTPVRRLGSLATQSEGAEASAKRMVERATREGNESLDFNEHIGRAIQSEENYRSVTSSIKRNPGSGMIRHSVYPVDEFVSVPQGGGIGRRMSEPSTRVRELEANAREAESIAKLRSKRKK